MRIGIVNDSIMACEVLRRVVLSVPGQEVAWIARDGEQAVAMTRSERPDVILMDLFMPVMDGVEATRRIMNEWPCPILVVTATVSGHISKVYQAMGHGALDAVDTPVLGSGGELAGAASLLRKLDVIGKLIGKAPPRPAEAPSPGSPDQTGPGAGAPSLDRSWLVNRRSVRAGGDPRQDPRRPEDQHRDRPACGRGIRPRTGPVAQRARGAKSPPCHGGDGPERGQAPALRNR